MTDALATKEDLEALELTFTNRFAAADLRFAAARFDAKLEAKLAQLELRMAVRLGGITVTRIGAVATLVGLF